MKAGYQQHRVKSERARHEGKKEEFADQLWKSLGGSHDNLQKFSRDECPGYMWGSKERVTTRRRISFWRLHLERQGCVFSEIFDRSDLGQRGSVLEVAVIIKRHGVEQKVVCFDQ